MNNLIKEIKETDIWKTIHSNLHVNDIIKYFEEGNKEYVCIKNFINFMIKSNDLEENFINERLFVSIIMIAKFPDDIIGKERIDKEDLIVDKAKEIYNLIIEEKIDKIHKKIFTFKIIFDNWKKEDKSNQLNILCEMYHNYNSSIEEYANDPSKEEYIKELIQMKERIINSMKQITNNYEYYIKDFKPKEFKYDEKVEKMIYTRLKGVYWENIRTEIFKNNNVNLYNQIISDYVYMINELRLRNLDLSILESLSEYELNEYNIIDAYSTLSRALIDINKQVDSENYDEIYTLLLSKLNDDKRYVVDIFKLCFERLEIVKKIRDEIDKKQVNQ